MPRHARLRLAGVPFHVIQRGHNRADCFHTDGDRRWYLAELRRQAVEHGVAVHAYVLMSNHIHLLVTPPGETSIEKMMKLLGQRYSQHFNFLRGRSGTLWGGRYRSCLVDTDGYLLTCHRYVEANPVRAGMVAGPGDHPWSSYRANAHGARDSILTAHPLVSALGRTAEDRQRAYCELFDTGIAANALEHIRSMTNAGLALSMKPPVRGRPKRAEAAAS